MNKEDVIHIYNGILLSLKMNEFVFILVRQIDLEPVIKSEASLKKKNKYHILTYIYIFGIQKNGINEPINGEEMEIQI